MCCAVLLPHTTITAIYTESSFLIPSESRTMSVIIKQSDFDKLVSESKDEGMSTSEAVEDVMQMIEDTEYNTSGLFVYLNDEEFLMKQRLQESLNTVERASKGSETFVNCCFAMGSIKQALLDSRNQKHVQQGTWRLCEAMNLFKVLTILLSVEEEEDEDESEDEDEDAEDIRINKILELMICLLDEGPAHCRAFSEFCELDEASMNSLIESMKRSLTEEETIAKYLRSVVDILEQEANREIFRAACELHGGLDEVVGMALKFHKENATIKTNVEKILAIVQ